VTQIQRWRSYSAGAGFFSGGKQSLTRTLKPGSASRHELKVPSAILRLAQHGMERIERDGFLLLDHDAAFRPLV
jgi:hypothetical protein